MKIKTVNEILKDTKMQNKECNFKITYPKGTSKLDLILERLDKLENEMHKGFSAINSRIDNLVVKNNLKE